jgi:hypothetical protein
LTRVVEIQLEMVRPNVPAPPTGNSETRYRVIYGKRVLGVWRDPEHSAARFLIDHGFAARGDTLRTFRGDALCMTGSIGWFADHRTLEDDTRGPVTVKWKPFPGRQVLAGQGSDDERGSFPSAAPAEENPLATNRGQEGI